MSWVLRSVRRDDAVGLARWLSIATALGSCVAIQGTEWLRLVESGLKASSGPYGATFFTLIGCHALHVFGAVTCKFCVRRVGVSRGRFDARHALPVELGAIYWNFVCIVRAVIFPVVYLGLR